MDDERKHPEPFRGVGDPRAPEQLVPPGAVTHAVAVFLLVLAASTFVGELQGFQWTLTYALRTSATTATVAAVSCSTGALLCAWLTGATFRRVLHGDTRIAAWVPLVPLAAWVVLGVLTVVVRSVTNTTTLDPLAALGTGTVPDPAGSDQHLGGTALFTGLYVVSFAATAVLAFLDHNPMVKALRDSRRAVARRRTEHLYRTAAHVAARQRLDRIRRLAADEPARQEAERAHAAATADRLRARARLTHAVHLGDPSATSGSSTSSH